MSNELKEKARQLPVSPGVYLMKDKSGTILYIGKAKKLKERVGSYFTKNSQQSNKVKRMLAQLCDFDVRLVDTELDALLLECNLIQQYRPMYNRQMNAFERYAYLQISQSQRGLKLRIIASPDASHSSKSDQVYTFGPYAGYHRLPEVKEVLERIYALNSYDSWQRLFQSPDHVPLDSQTVLDELLQAFSGQPQAIQQRIEAAMLEASEHMRYIQAAQWRDSGQQVATFFQRNDQLLLSPLMQRQWHALWLPTDHGWKCYLILQGLVRTTKVFPQADPEDEATLLHAAKEILPAKPPMIEHFSKKQIDHVAILLLYLKRTPDYRLLVVETSKETHS